MYSILHLLTFCSDFSSKCLLSVRWRLFSSHFYSSTSFHPVSSFSSLLNCTTVFSKSSFSSGPRLRSLRHNWPPLSLFSCLSRLYNIPSQHGHSHVPTTTFIVASGRTRENVRWIRCGWLRTVEEPVEWVSTVGLESGAGVSDVRCSNTDDFCSNDFRSQASRCSN